MSRALWAIQGGGIYDGDLQISNVTITITDTTGKVEGETVVAVCNGKTFSSVMTKGICKIYSTEVGTYTITAGEYSTMLVCPYFGAFSTDIYSGVLKVTCIEEGGNNKTCHVQSCDDSYNFTDDYNLTQTFDSSLILTFLGIPAGRYLITVDDRYRYYKEIVSIQSVNEIEVELKQWLYKEGDQCQHNTGGWMQCLVGGTSAGTDYGGSYSASQSVQFLNNAIKLTQSCYAGVGSFYDTLEHQTFYTRHDVASNVYCGTKKEITGDLKKYTQVNIVKTNSSVVSIRCGNANSTSTTTSTATIIASSTGNTFPVSSAESAGYIVLGKSASYGYLVRLDYNPGTVNYSFTDTITQIYLV